MDALSHAEGLPAEGMERHHALVQEELQRLGDDIAETQQRLFECRCVLINICVRGTGNFYMHFFSKTLVPSTYTNWNLNRGEF